ncbi:MAG: hypothetical protein M3082_06675 [Candidatus Dormibacteraeota bacterium]|nr:hypothetical protein [Candidatus Dormibacteraeota bacterium]MDQ6900486.1 hypothetical protein [Candidatus Dormibacteraeota bacterium]
MGGVLVALVVIGAVVWALHAILMPGGDRLPPAYPTPTPTPSGVELQRANAFWNNQVYPSLGVVVTTLPAMKSQCLTGSPRAGCRAAMIATDQTLQQTITIIKHGDIPACIATHVTTFMGDVEAMDGGLQISLNGYRAGDRAMITQGLIQFTDGVRPLVADGELVNRDLKAFCH